MLRLKNSFIRSVQILINIAVKSQLKIKIEGRRNIPKTASALLVANHASYLDVPILGHTFFSNLMNISWVISQDNYRAWYLKWLYAIFNVIQVNGTIEKALKELDNNRWVVIFPEGEKRWCPPKKAKKQKAKKGAAIIALSTGVTIIPVTISGADKVLPPRTLKYQNRHTIKVRIGKPFSYQRVDQDKIDEKTAQSVTQEIIEKIQPAAKIKEYQKSSS